MLRTIQTSTHFVKRTRRSRLLSCAAAILLVVLLHPAGAAAQSAAPDTLSGHHKMKAPHVSGFIQAHYRYALDTGADSLVDNDNFRIQRVRIGIDGDVYPWLSYNVEIDPRSPDIISLLRDAFITFKFIPRHKLRVGQQKTQFGYENVESSSRLFAVNRTEVSDNLSRGVNLRDIGIGLLGNLKLGGGWRIEDAVTVVNGAGMNVQDDNTRKKNVWGRVGLRYKSDARGNLLARVGVSGAVGDQFDEGDDPLDPTDDFRNKFDRVGADVELDHDLFLFTAEYVLGHDENAATGEKDDPSGYYVNLVGKTRWEVGPIARFDTLGDEFKRWTLGAYYGSASAPLRVMINYELRKLKDGVRGDDKLYAWVQVRY